MVCACATSSLLQARDVGKTELGEGTAEVGAVARPCRRRAGQDQHGSMARRLSSLHWPVEMTRGTILCLRPRHVSKVLKSQGANFPRNIPTLSTVSARCFTSCHKGRFVYRDCATAVLYSGALVVRMLSAEVVAPGLVMACFHNGLLSLLCSCAAVYDWRTACAGVWGLFPPLASPPGVAVSRE